MTGLSAVCLARTMSDSETVAPSPASPLPPSPSPEPEATASLATASLATASLATATLEEPMCFRLPTAVLTRAEMRKHVLAEVVLWLTGPVLSAARLATDEEESGATGQLIQIMDALKSKEGAPEDRAEALGAAAALTAETCQRFLLDPEARPVDDVEDLMMDFIDEITVDGEQTLQDLWGHSPFEALREAPPLTEDDEEDEDEDEDAADTYQNRMARLLEAPLEFRLPLGALVAIVVVLIAYLFLVAVVSQRRH